MYIYVYICNMYMHIVYLRLSTCQPVRRPVLFVPFVCSTTTATTTTTTTTTRTTNNNANNDNTDTRNNTHTNNHVMQCALWRLKGASALCRSFPYTFEKDLGTPEYLYNIIENSSFHYTSETDLCNIIEK